MKHTFTGMMIALTLVAVMVGAMALAETAEPAVPELPAVEQTQPEQAPAQADTSAADSALQDAFKAYNDAKSSSRQDDLEAELKGYVESGKLTQAQADLILNYYKEQQSLRNGTCPNCGYQFQYGQGKGGRMNGGKGNRMGGGFGGKGGRGMMGMNGMNGQQPSMDQQPSQNSRSADGMAFGFEAQTLPEMSNADDMI
jgi:hypothetical protein